jgi:cysteine synthase/rhodanese-related sulfurtransferase
MNEQALRVYDSILGLHSNENNPTPLVRINKVVPFEHATVFAKLEWYNPFGAVKDRIALNLLQDAEEKGLLGQGMQLVEPTSGNTGLGLAMMANAKGYPLRTTLSKMIPLEKRAILRFFGSDVLELDDELCPAPGAPEGAIAIARQTAADLEEFHMLDQYRNEANPESHYKTTGPEVWKQTEGRVTHFVAGLGTCGTITGTGRFLKEKKAEIKVLGVHPGEGHDIPGVRSIRQLSQTELFRPEEYDEMAMVTNEEAYALCQRLVSEESIIAGPSSAMALAGACKMVPDEPGNIAVIIFPDNIFKYASSVIRHFPALFENTSGAQGASTQSGPNEALMEEMIENARGSGDTIEVGEAHELMKGQGALFIDVRSKERFERRHLSGAVNMPLAQLGQNRSSLPGDKDAPVIAVCDVGNVSLIGMLYLKSLGHRNVKSMNGGTTAWAEQGLPTE